MALLYSHFEVKLVCLVSRLENGRRDKKRMMDMAQVKMLLITDPQMDLITGTLSVPGAAEAMNALARHIDGHGASYAVKIVTGDWHPYNHCSFDRRGGQWPPHCVQHSAGAALWQPLLESLNQSRGGFTMLYKGDRVDKDEKSVMRNANSGPVLLRLIEALRIDRIEICGLPGNTGVLNVMRDLMAVFGAEKLCLLDDFAPSLDDGSTLNTFVKEHGIATL